MTTALGGRRIAAALGLVSALVAGAASAKDEAPGAPPASATRLTPESRDRFAAALAALRAQDWRAAAAQFGDTRWPSTPLGEYALLFQAQALHGAGDDAGARPLALRTAQAAADARLAPTALLAAAVVLSGAGDESAAVTFYRRFVAEYPDHAAAPRARLALGEALLASGRTAEAARAFRDLWVRAPTTAEAQSAAGQLRVLAERGLAGAPPTARERVERAERLLAAGQPALARTEAEALLAEDLPSETQARTLRVVFDTARRTGRNDTALAVINRALGALPGELHPPWLLDLARIQQRKSQDQAIQTVDKLARSYPKSPEAPRALALKGRLLEGVRNGDARATYAELASRYPDDDEAGAALWRLGWLAWFERDYAEASANWGRIMTVRGGRGHREAATYWLGRVDQLRGEPESAARRFREIDRDAPRSYYGILAAPRVGTGDPAPPPPGPSAPALPADPLTALQGDAGAARVEALRDVGLAAFADDELADMVRRSPSDLRRLFGLSALYAQEERHHEALRVLRRHFQPIARSGLPSVPRSFWEMFYPVGWRPALTQAAQQAAVDPMLVAAIAREESSFNAQARSRVGARGLMQLMPDTARPMARARGLAFADGALLDEPAANLELGSAYFAGLLREFTDSRVAVAAYNAGPARVREWWGARRSDDLDVWVEQIPFDETRAFVKRVMLSWDEYRRLYGGSGEAGRAAAPVGRTGR